MKKSQIKVIQDPAGQNACWVEWVEPFHKKEPVIMRVTAATAIAAQKRAASEKNPNFKYKSDEQALEDFIAIHWAKLMPADLSEHVRVLEMKLGAMQRWKDEAIMVGSWWEKVDEAVRKHPSCKLGAIVPHEALRIIQEHRRLERRCECMTAGLLEIRDLDYRGNRHTSADIAQRTIEEASKL